jgi:hypothetical protein
VPGLDVVLDVVVVAYGPSPGVELIPYFLALLGWVGLALFSIVFSPIKALLRRLRGKASQPPPPVPPSEPMTASVPKAPEERSHDNR